MSEIELFVGLLAVVAVVSLVARWIPVPVPILLLGAGVLVGLVPEVGEFELDPDVIFLVFLPPLVHAAAWQTNVRDLRQNARTVGLLAVGLVAVTTAAVAAVAHAVVPGLGWGPAVVLGAIVSPTDTVAATAIFRRLGVPERVVALVEGESLINDGAALVLYRLAVAAVATGVFSLGEATLNLLVVGAGGALLGLAVAYVVAYVRRQVDDPVVEITLTLLTPYLAFLPAEGLHLSGVLAAVSSGLFLGLRAARDFTPSTRLQASGFWSVFTFGLESVLFVLIGLQVPGVLEALGDEPVARLLLSAVLVSLAVIAARLAFQFTVGELEASWDRRRGTRPPLGRRERAVLGWSGMRGAVSLAAALAVPLETVAGTPFPERNLILFLTLAVIGSTLLLQGLTLPALIRRLGVEEVTSDGRSKAIARFRTIEAALDRISDLSFGSDVPPAAIERARDMYATRAQQLTGACRDGVPDHAAAADALAFAELRRELLAVEHAALLELRDEGRVGLGAIREVQRDLDLEAARLDRTMQPLEDTRAEPARTA